MLDLFFEQGDTEGATAHLQRLDSIGSVKPMDLELLCNVQIKQLGLVIEPVWAGRWRRLSCPELRLNATRLGDPLVTAGVHTFVAQMDASRGLFQASAERHLRLADALVAGRLRILGSSAHSCNIKLAGFAFLSLDIERGQVLRGARKAAC